MINDATTATSNVIAAQSGEVRIGVCKECNAPAFTPRAWTQAGDRPLRRTCSHTAPIIHEDEARYTKAQGPLFKRAGW